MLRHIRVWKCFPATEMQKSNAFGCCWWMWKMAQNTSQAVLLNARHMQCTRIQTQIFKMKFKIIIKEQTSENVQRGGGGRCGASRAEEKITTTFRCIQYSNIYPVFFFFFFFCYNVWRCRRRRCGLYVPHRVWWHSVLHSLPIWRYVCVALNERVFPRLSTARSNPNLFSALVWRDVLVLWLY